MKLRLSMILAAVVVWCGGLVTTTNAGVLVEGTDPARTIVRFTMENLDLKSDTVGGAAVTTVTLPGALPRQEAGAPELPTLTATLRIPAQGSPAYRIISRRERELATAPVRPSLGHLTRDRDPSGLVAEFGPVYGGGEVFPAAEVVLEKPFLLGDRRGVTLRLNPVRWDAARGVLLLTEALTVEVVTTGSGGVNALPAGAPAASAAFRAGQNRTFANVTADPVVDKAFAPLARGRMLIISDDDFLPALAPFRAWKARRGIATEVVPMSATAGSAAALRKVIADNYNAAPGLTWVLLVGDREQVPTNTGLYDGSDSDTRYAMILGDDLYPEVYVSRVSVRTLAEARTQLGKFVAYEREPDVGAAAAWYGRAAGVASDEGVPADFERAEQLRSDLLSRDFVAVDRIYQGLGATGAAISGAVNEGRSLLNYLGHGSGVSWDSVPFTTTDVAGLANGGRLPWIIDVSCSNGDFSRPTCFAEAWLRAGTATAPAGAVGMIAASSLAPWTPPTVMQAEVVDLLAAAQAYDLGTLFYSGLVKVADEYAGVPVATQVMEQNIVFGDASLQVRTRAPAVFAATLPALVDPAGGAVSVAIDLPATGTVAVTDGGDLLGAVDFAGAGVVRVPLAGLAALDSVTVTLTGANMVPWERTLAIGTAATPVLDRVVSPAPVLRGNYPNPFNPVTRIAFELPAGAAVRLTVYDVSGRLVARLADGRFPAGLHEIPWQGRDDGGRALPSGIYLYRLESPAGNQVGRMVLAK